MTVQIDGSKIRKRAGARRSDAETVSPETQAKPRSAARDRTGGRGSGLLKLADVDLKISVENAATVALAKKLNLVA